MVKIALQLKANFENVESLTPSSDPDFRWYLKFVCNNCGEVCNKWIYTSVSDNQFVIKCKLCLRENSLVILSDTVTGIHVDSCNELKTVVVFDCRGLEPKEFAAREGWVVKAENNGNTFTDVDLSEGEWVDFCDKTNQPVVISELEHNFKRIK
jgi:hypothetical protein